MQTRQQKDALRALEDVQAIQQKAEADPKNGEELKKNYATAVHRFPFLVRQNGLQQTLAFYAGKAAAKQDNDDGQTSPSVKAEQFFLRHIVLVLKLGAADPVNELLNAPLEKYMYYSRRCLEVAVWYRRFVESVLKVDATGNLTKNEENKKETGDVYSDATESPS
jgi:CRISPR-associated protein Cmr5